MTTVVFNGGGGVPELHSNKEKEEEEEEENGKKKTTATTEEKKEEEQQQLLPYLDQDMVTKILVKVGSAESLYNSLRYVCKSWSNIIFDNPEIHLNSLLPSRPPCLIIQNEDDSSYRYLKTKTEEERFEIAYNRSYTTCSVKMAVVRDGIVLEQQVDDLTPILNKLCIRACANGLILASPYGLNNHKTPLCVVNPLTNHRVVLPPRPIHSNVSPLPVGFVFLPSTGKYKVVVISGHDPGDQTKHNFIQVLTLSSSSSSGNCCDDPSTLWRLIEAPPSLFSDPLAIHGVLYWLLSNWGEDYLVSFDVAAEVFYTPPPNSLFFYKSYGGFIEIGGYLAFWYFLPDEEELAAAESRTFHVHVIEDLHKQGGGGGEWKVLHDGVRMDMDFIKTRQSIPVLSIGNGEVMIFSHSSQGALWAYNFRSQRWWKVGHSLKEWDKLNFYGFHVENSTPVPFDSLFSTVWKHHT